MSLLDLFNFFEKLDSMPCIEYLRLKFATYYIICIAEMH